MESKSVVSTETNSKSVSTNCFICKKNTVYNMKCRCDEYFCRKHFDTRKHSCTYDFEKYGKAKLGDNLQKVENAKIEVL